MKRTSGILMPVLSLPGGQGIGGFGKSCFEFLDFLSAAGQSVWQILPVGPTGFGNSPYQCCSAFAGNPFFIDLEQLAADGLLEKKDYAALNWGKNPAQVDYEMLAARRLPILRKAFAAFKALRPLPGCDTWRSDEFVAFTLRASGWLPDYALFMAAKVENDGAFWQEWPEELRTRRPEAMEKLAREQADEIDFWCFVQFEFDKQWRAVKAYAKKLGISIMGDLPIYVSPDSADAWAGEELFEMTPDGRPARVAGCPPDFFCEDGQHWGNPLYNWDYHRRTGFAWWIMRMRAALETYDMVRIDHFRGFDTYWAIPAGEKTARGGKWEQGPGMELFRALTAALGPLPVVAEDLGEMFESVRQLLRDSGYPGMKVLQFAFDGTDNDFLPHNHPQNCAAYPGTHDNTTLRDWLEKSGTPAEVKRADAYFAPAKGESRVRAWLRGLMACPAALAVAPMFDWLELDGSARINTPGTVGNNWCWRALPGSFTPRLASEIRALTETYCRTADKS